MQMHKSKSGYAQSAEDLVKSFRLHEADSRQFIEDYLEALGSPYALSIWLQFHYMEHKDIIFREFDFLNYNDPEACQVDFAAYSFLRKYSDFNVGIDKKAVALDTFRAMEEHCKKTDKRLKSYLGGNTKCPNEAVLHGVIRKLDKVLGAFDVDAFLQMCNWGPGSTLSIKGNDTSSTRKFDQECDITPEAKELFNDVFSWAFPNWWPYIEKHVVSFNSITTVPKNAKTDRIIAIEPGLNSFIQHGIGKLIRKRLRYAGYNLDSDYFSREGARKGSVSGELATVDFSSASDSISKELVRMLVPPVWYQVLDSSRSHFFKLDGKVHKAEKFSTMGNGFTFELESAIFLCLALSCCEALGVDDYEVAVFGDDIIIPVEAFRLYSEMSEFLGFRVNQKKSFSSDSCFRESCGTYYFRGHDIKPYFLKGLIRYAFDLFKSANSVRAQAARFKKSGCDIRFRGCWNYLVGKVPGRLRLFGPLTLGDSVLEALPISVGPHPRGWDGFNVKALLWVAKHTSYDTRGLLLARLTMIGTTASAYNNNVPMRRITKPVVKRVFCKQWDTRGGWC